MSVIKPLNPQGGGTLPTYPVKAEIVAGTAASVKTGYLVIEDGGNAGYDKAAPDATDSTSTIKGIAAGESTETAALDGRVEIVRAPVIIARMKATTPGNLARTVINTKCTLDVSSGSYTVDENDTSNGFIKILDYDNTTDGNCIVEIACEV